MCVVVDFFLLILSSIIVALIFPGETSGKMPSDFAIGATGVLLFMLSAFYKSKMRIKWSASISSILIPVILFICLLPIMDNHLMIRISLGLLTPISLVTLMLAVEQLKRGSEDEY